MKILYIKEKEEDNKLKQMIKKILNIIDVEYIDNKMFLIIPTTKKSKDRTNRRIARKLTKMLYKECIQNVVLSTKLLENNILKNYLYSKNINILDGRKLFSILATKVVNEICVYSKTSIEKIEISILVNDNSEMNIENIIKIAQDVKRLNIITNHVEKFENLQNYLYNELGIMIKVSNNKKKDLLNSQIILNMDFTEELINKYKLPSKSVIVNLNNEINIKSKNFNGININYYNILMKETYRVKQFNDEIIYESMIYEYCFEKAYKQIIKDNIKIKSFLGKNGEINKKEFNQIIN